MENGHLELRRPVKGQAKSTIEEFARDLAAGLGKVPGKFVQDTVTGIHKARSVNLTDIATALHEDVELHATHKRLSRNLARPELNEFLSDRLLQLGAKRVKKNTRLIVHVYDLHKKYACKMEYLDAQNQGTYRVCEVVASDLGSRIYVPLFVSLWSRVAPGYVSDADEIESVVRRVMCATSGRGVLYFNGGAIDSAVLDRLVCFEDSRFEVETDLDEKLLYRSKETTAGELGLRCETQYGVTMFKLLNDVEHSIFCHYGTIPVRLARAPKRKFQFVSLKCRGIYGQDILIGLLTSESIKRNRQNLTDAVMSFTGCPDVVEESLRHKNEFKPEAFRVLTYERGKLLQTLLQAVVLFESSVARCRSVREQIVELEPREGVLERDFLLPGIATASR